MTPKNACWVCLRVLVLIAVALAARKMWASDLDIPTVHILAPDPCAAELGQDTATFMVYRSGPTNSPLLVRYRLAGTAINGVDYDELSGSVTIPACASSAPITIAPIDDLLVEGAESVAVFLDQPALWPPPYIVCWPSFALGHIEDNDFPPVNHPPAVRLVNPPDESVFIGPLDLSLVAHATDPDGWVRSVEFFDGDTSLGVVLARPRIIRPVAVLEDAFEVASEADPAAYPDLELDIKLDPDAVDVAAIRPSVFALIWTNVPPGAHILTAVVTDNQGASTRSQPVHIRVTEPPPQPIVNVRATDPVAAEPDPTADRLNTATFTIHRTGSTDFPLTVYYRLGGSAENGVDYRELPYNATIPIGARTVDVVVAPIDDNLVEGPEGVVLALVPPVCVALYPPPPDCYRVGPYHAARAVIHDNDVDPGNQPPVVEIVRPIDGSVFLAPADIVLVAQARDFDGRVQYVEFFEGTNSLGVVSNTPSLLDTRTPQFALKWPSVRPGHYLLTAEATDDDGATSPSKPVEIKVVERTLPPVVSVESTDSEAAEVAASGEPNPAVFTVKRTGPTDRPLWVYYSLGGTAENGVDYELLPGRVAIPIGASSARIVVNPIDDRLVEGPETVGLTIDPPICIAIFPQPPDCYIVGADDRARAVIRDNDVAPTNLPPRIAIIHPAEGDIFVSPEDIRICAETKDADGYVRSVEFFAGTTSLGVVSNNLAASWADTTAAVDLIGQIFCFDWQNVPPGGYVLTAKATDNRGASSVSDPVRIKVIEANRPPVVTIETIYPYASEGDGIIDPVDTASGGVGVIQPPIIIRPRVAIFEVKRDRGTNVPLTVYYSVGGTASNGEDYKSLDGKITIPQGAWRARLIVDPIDDDLGEGTETVIVSLDPISCPRIIPPPPECYLVGDPARAVAFILDNDLKNQPPKVEIVAPSNGDVFPEKSDIAIDAKVSDPDGYVTDVEFFEGTNSIGKDSRVYIVAPPPGEIHHFSIVWSNVPPGRYHLTALATDSAGATSRSAPVDIKVLGPCAVPVVTIVAIDRVATEQNPLIDSIPDTATFRVTRSCGSNTELTVKYTVGGNAINGSDYRELDGTVTIPAGAEWADIPIFAVDDGLLEGTETVEITLDQPNCLGTDPAPAGCYLVGRPGRDLAYIRDNALFSPQVAVVRPETGDKFRASSDIPIVVQAVDPDGWVTRVEFIANNQVIGVQEIHFFTQPPPGQLQRFSMIWSNVQPGQYALKANAIDDSGAANSSLPVDIEVVKVLPPPVVNIFAVDALAREGNPPNVARFRVRRSGETNEPLVVHYDIRGTAANGRDYELIAGTVTIPAGRRGAPIIIVPINDNLPEPVETVILRLQESALYTVGRWNRAGAIVIDNDCPRPGTIQLPDHFFHLCREAIDGRYYRLRLSSNFETWEALRPNVVVDGAIHFVDPESTETPQRFYRLDPVPDVEIYEDDE